jgi:hypothetical protein
MLLADAEQPRSILANFIIPLLPWFVLFFFVWLSGRWQSRPAMKLISELRQHMVSIEAKLDRLIEAIEKRNSGG